MRLQTLTFKERAFNFPRNPLKRCGSRVARKYDIVNVLFSLAWLKPKQVVSEGMTKLVSHIQLRNKMQTTERTNASLRTSSKLTNCERIIFPERDFPPRTTEKRFQPIARRSKSQEKPKQHPDNLCEDAQSCEIEAEPRYGNMLALSIRLLSDKYKGKHWSFLSCRKIPMLRMLTSDILME